MWSFCWTWVRCLKRNSWCRVSLWRAWRPWFALPSFSSLLSRPSTCHAHTQDIAWSSHGKWSHCLSGDARTPWVWPLCGWRGLSCETAETSSFFPALLWFCVNFCIFALSPMSWMSLVGASVGQDEHSWSILALRHTGIADIDFDLTDLYTVILIFFDRYSSGCCRCWGQQFLSSSSRREGFWFVAVRGLQPLRVHWSLQDRWLAQWIRLVFCNDMCMANMISQVSW